MPNIPGLENVNWLGAADSIIFWLKWAVYGIAIIAAMAIGYLLMTYNIKVQTYQLYGSGKDGVFSIQKKKWNRVKWTSGRTAWKPLLPLLNKTEVEPFDAEFIYPGRQVYVFDLNGVWIPGRINVNKSEESLRAEINPVPYYVRNWQSLTHKKHAHEFAEHSFWDDNKTLITALIAAFAILAAAVATVYLTYQLAGGGSADIQALTNALKGIGNIPGSGPQ